MGVEEKGYTKNHCYQGYFRTAPIITFDAKNCQRQNG